MAPVVKRTYHPIRFYWGYNMKNLICAAALSLTASAALAGGMNEPAMEVNVSAETIAAEAAAGSDDWAGVLIAFLTIVVVGVGN